MVIDGPFMWKHCQNHKYPGWCETFPQNNHIRHKVHRKKIFRPKPINFCLQKHNYEALNEESLNVSNLEFHPMKSTPQAHNILEDNNVNKHHYKSCSYLHFKIRIWEIKHANYEPHVDRKHYWCGWHNLTAGHLCVFVEKQRTLSVAPRTHDGCNVNENVIFCCSFEWQKESPF